MQLLTYKTDGGEKVGLHVQGTVYDIQACLEEAGADLGASVPDEL